MPTERSDDLDHSRALNRRRAVRYRARMKSTWKGLAKSLVRSARDRSIRTDRMDDFELTEEWFLRKLKRQEYRCSMTGREFELSPDRRFSPWQASLDRINNDKGYTKRNTRIVCLIYNLARNSNSDAEILEFASYLVARDEDSQ